MVRRSLVQPLHDCPAVPPDGEGRGGRDVGSEGPEGLLLPVRGPLPSRQALSHRRRAVEGNALLPSGQGHSKARRGPLSGIRDLRPPSGLRVHHSPVLRGPDTIQRGPPLFDPLPSEGAVRPSSGQCSEQPRILHQASDTPIRHPCSHPSYPRRLYPLVRLPDPAPRPTCYQRPLRQLPYD